MFDSLRSCAVRGVAALAVLALTASLAATQQVPEVPMPEALLHELTDLADVDTFRLPALDAPALHKEDHDPANQGGAYRFAIPTPVVITPETAGTWETLPDGRLVWRFVVQAEGATSLNFGFARYELPQSAALHIYAPDGVRRIRPFTSADNDLHGELWTPVVLADEVVLELSVAPREVDKVGLVLTHIGHGYRGFGTRAVYAQNQGNYLASGSCNYDVVCSEGDDWPLEISAVAALQLFGSDLCTGSMINDTTSSLTPYFLTAAHCGVNSGNDSSLVAYWNYENSFCRTPGTSGAGGPGDGPLTMFNSGTMHRATYSPSDVTLLEFDDDPNPLWDVGFAGWDRTGADASTAIAIHHPDVEEKRISFEFQPTTITTYLNNPVPGDGTHVRVEDWDLGTTEPGSSGSPLFNQDHRIIGQLHGGFASCSSQTSDWYGNFAVSWTGGGTNSSRLSNWLDPTGSGLTTTDSISLNTLCSSAGEISLGAVAVGCAGAIEAVVVDCDPNTNPLVAESLSINVSSQTEPAGELIVLTETGPDTGRFKATVVTGSGLGVVDVTEGDTLSATYVDADDGIGGTNVQLVAQASVDCTAPGVSNVAASGIDAVGATIDFDASESVSASIRYGTSCGALNESENALGSGVSHSVALSGLDDDTTYRYVVDVTDAAGNLTTEDNGGGCYSFTTLPATDYYTEEFISDNDVDNRSLSLVRIGGQDFYDACGDAITALPTDPAGGTVLSMTDDDSELVSITGGARVHLYGVQYNQVWVGSNGYLTFGVSDSDYTETLSEHFDLPRVAPLYDDLNPSVGGTVSYKQLADRFVVSWENVPEYSTSNSNTFQVEMFFNGDITLSWLGIEATDGIVGLSAGSGLPLDFIEDNLGNAGSCGAICQTDLGFGGPGSSTLSMCGGDLSTGTTADILLTGAEPGGTAFFVLGFSSAPTAFKGGLLVPVPAQFIKPFGVNGAGEVLLAGVPGGGGPVTVYIQFASTNGSAPFGYGFSNALEVVVLP